MAGLWVTLRTMDKGPFSVYDFFAYLSAGVVVLFGIAFARHGTRAFDLDLNAVQALALVVAAYIAGHVVAAISSDTPGRPPPVSGKFQMVSIISNSRRGRGMDK